MFTLLNRRPAVSSQFLTISMSGGVMRVQVTGPSINERASRVIAKELGDAITNAGRRLKSLVLDMKSVTHMASIGLGLCIDVRNSANANGAKTYTVNMNRELTDLFRMMRIDRLFTMAFNDEELEKLLRN